MKRRDFLKAAAAMGVGVTTAGILPTKEAAAQGAAKKFVLNIQLRGGPAFTSLLNPKFTVEPDFTQADVAVAGNLDYLPYNGADAFIQANFANMCVIRGIDCTTNGHDQGRQIAATGALQEGYPSLMAAIAAKQSGALPLAFFGGNGVDDTAGLIAPVIADSRSTDLITKIAFPNRLDADNANSLFHSEFAQEQIKAATTLRLEQQSLRMRLPKRRNTMAQLFASRMGEGELENVLQYLNVDTNGMEQIARQAMVPLGAFTAGLGQTGIVSMGGFDTHGNHFQRMNQLTAQIWTGFQQIIDQAVNLGIAQDLIIVMNGDFGRTPNYNGGMGKDHWPIAGEVIWSGSADNGIPLNTVIGASDDGDGPVTVNPQTLVADPNGIRLMRQHVHSSFRKLFGIENDAISRQFPLGVEHLPLFGA